MKKDILKLIGTLAIPAVLVGCSGDRPPRVVASNMHDNSDSSLVINKRYPTPTPPALFETTALPPPTPSLFETTALPPMPIQSIPFTPTPSLFETTPLPPTPFPTATPVNPCADPEIGLIALTTLNEANTLPTAQEIVIKTIFNRVEDPRFPDTPTGVINQPRQFAAPYPNNANRYPQTVTTDACRLVAEVRENGLPPGLQQFNESMFFHTADPDKAPYWANRPGQIKELGRIDTMAFYAYQDEEK